jgi:hypothetical protein
MLKELKYYANFVLLKERKNTQIKAKKKETPKKNPERITFSITLVFTSHDSLSSGLELLHSAGVAFNKLKPIEYLTLDIKVARGISLSVKRADMRRLGLSVDSFLI